MDWVAVVDDDILNLKMAGHILSKHNMRVTALKSGTALIEFIKTNKPDLILLDIKMPGMDGFETLQRLQEQTSLRNRRPVGIHGESRFESGSRFAHGRRVQPVFLKTA